MIYSIGLKQSSTYTIKMLLISSPTSKPPSSRPVFCKPKNTSDFKPPSKCINPLSPKSDQRQISPFDVNAL